MYLNDLLLYSNHGLSLTQIQTLYLIFALDVSYNSWGYEGPFYDSIPYIVCDLYHNRNVWKFAFTHKL